MAYQLQEGALLINTGAPHSKGREYLGIRGQDRPGRSCLADQSLKLQTS